MQCYNAATWTTSRTIGPCRVSLPKLVAARSPPSLGREDSLGEIAVFISQPLRIRTLLPVSLLLASEVFVSFELYQFSSVLYRWLGATSYSVWSAAGFVGYGVAAGIAVVGTMRVWRGDFGVAERALWALVTGWLLVAFFQWALFLGWWYLREMSYRRRFGFSCCGVRPSCLWHSSQSIQRGAPPSEGGS